jgi:hypothetical protein
MDATQTTSLRTRIATLASQHVPPREIAKQLGCARTTVYKFLRSPSVDRRTVPRRRPRRTPPHVVATVLRAAAADPLASAADLHTILLERAHHDPAAPKPPSEPTIRRILRQHAHRAPLPSAGDAHLADPDLDARSAYDLVAEDDPDAAALAALRVLLRQALVELSDPQPTVAAAGRLRVRRQAVDIALGLARLTPPRAAGAADRVAHLSAQLDHALADLHARARARSSDANFPRPGARSSDARARSAPDPISESPSAPPPIAAPVHDGARSSDRS